MRVFKQWIIIAITFAMVAGLGTYLTHTSQSLHQGEQRFLLSELISSQASAIERRLERSFSATRILSQEVLQHRGLFADFESYAEEVINSIGGISNLQLAPEGVVQYIHPLAGNEKAIGHDILKQDARRYEALKAIREHRMTVAGPFHLVQGGVGLIGRNPIFLPTDEGERFWGFASALIFVDDLLQVTDLDQWESRGYRFSLSRQLGDGNTWEAFAQSRLPISENALTVPIQLPNAVWHLTMSPPPGSNNQWYYGYLLTILASLIAAIMAWFILRQPEVLRTVVAKKTRELKLMAHQDHLTGLSNRRFLSDQLERLLRDFERSKRSAVLLYLDLDDFKRINDSMGHSVGDQFLLTIAQRIHDAVRQGDIVARLGGDEFGVLLQNTESVADIAKVAEKLLQQVRGPVQLHNRVFTVSASVGITLIPQDGKDVTTLLRNADLAMYASKRAGKGHYQFYDNSLQAAALEKIELEQDLVQALSNNEFLLHYQPFYDLHSGKLAGFEALVRWRHPERGLLFPDIFIPVAEECGKIIEMGYVILEQACWHIKQLEQRYPYKLRVAVNLSQRQFKDPLLLETIRLMLERHQVDAHMLELEITESCLMDNVASSIETLIKLSELGISIAIDDFGTGYSSLSMLKRLPVSKLKIDRSFIQDLEVDLADRKIVQGVIT
ncbi:EAL domain-containing protein, partial [Pontibacter sp. JAM-7]|uniref:bifunctional diguanylate cyclase/phosphodiesterase n=1 Tax=Pontibacter sp. JAM-7 TaxID=3366581 RepID=UPI003AF7B78E